MMFNVICFALFVEFKSKNISFQMCLKKAYQNCIVDNIAVCFINVNYV